MKAWRGVHTGKRRCTVVREVCTWQNDNLAHIVHFGGFVETMWYLSYGIVCSCHFDARLIRHTGCYGTTATY